MTAALDDVVAAAPHRDRGRIRHEDHIGQRQNGITLSPIEDESLSRIRDDFTDVDGAGDSGPRSIATLAATGDGCPESRQSRHSSNGVSGVVRRVISGTLSKPSSKL